MARSDATQAPGGEGLPSSDDLLRFMAKRGYSPMTGDELAAEFDVPDAARDAFDAMLRDLEMHGDVVRVKQGRYSTPGRVNLIVGRLQCNPRGFGFIMPLRPDAFEDAYVSAEDMGAAMNRDIVAARNLSRRGRPAAEVVNVVRHARDTFVGVYEERGGFGYVAPDDPGCFKDIAVAREDLGGAQPHDKVAVEITVWPSRHLPPQGKVVEVLGRKGDAGVDVRSIIIEFDLADVFDDAVAAEVERVPRRVGPKEIEHRLDLRDDTVFTVDPADARDFDDAVSVSRAANGDWRLGVHIADVSHYVAPDSAIGREALARATSVYLPGHVIPMLPERLSNGMCSLVEGHARLTKSVVMTFDADGRLKDAKIHKSVIRSVKRLNYGQLLDILEGREAPKNTPPKVVDDARRMGELAALLRVRRIERGMLELDMPEARLELDGDGKVTAVNIERGDAAHRLIEDFMLAANEAVADYLVRRRLPAIARVHPAPDPGAIKGLSRAARGLGFSLPETADRAEMQRMLRAAHQRPGGYAIILLLLRSLKRAEYRAEWEQHFGLAAEHYTHFTSPIRRLPDLLVHTLLDADLRGDPVPDWAANLAEWMDHASFAERRAEDAERELTKIKTLEYLKQFRNETFDAVVVGIEDYGLWVELSDYLIDGLVRVSSLVDDFYHVDRTGTRLEGSRGRRFVIGQEIKVRIASIDDLKRQLNFLVVTSREERKSRKRR